MALATTNFGSDVPAPINNVYMRSLLRAARKVLPFFNATLPGMLEKMQGSNTVKWRRIENLAAVTTALSELSSGATAAFGVGRTTVTPTIHNITKAVAKYANGILTTEEVDLFNINTTTIGFMEALGANAGESLNSVARLEFDNATQVRFANGVSANSVIISKMAANDIRWAVNKLNVNAAEKIFPQGTGSKNINTSTVRSSFVGICHPDVEEDIRQLTNFIGVEQYGGYTETLVGEFGAVGGVRWVSSQIAPITTAAAKVSVGSAGQFRHTTAATSADKNDVYTSYIYGKDAVGTIGLGAKFGTSVTKMYDSKPKAIEIIYHKPGSSGVGDPFNEIGTLSWKAWHATKILDGRYLVKLNTLAGGL